MRALVGHHTRRSAFTTVERQLLAEDPNRDDRPLGELVGEVNRLPVAPKVASRQRARTSMYKIVLFDDRIRLGIRTHLTSRSASARNAIMGRAFSPPLP